MNLQINTNLSELEAVANKAKAHGVASHESLRICSDGSRISCFTEKGHLFSLDNKGQTDIYNLEEPGKD